MSAEINLKISSRYHQIVFIEARAKHCLKNEYPLSSSELEHFEHFFCFMCYGQKIESASYEISNNLLRLHKISKCDSD